jgi:hypothetical protein
MSDVDTKVRSILQDLADQAPIEPVLPAVLRRRVHRRRALNVALASGLAAVIVTGAVFGVAAAIRVRGNSTVQPAGGASTEASSSPTTQSSATPDVDASPYTELKAEVTAMRTHLAAVQAAQQPAEEQDVRQFIELFMRLRLIGAPDTIDFLSPAAKAQYDQHQGDRLYLYDDPHGGDGGLTFAGWRISEIRRADANSFEVDVEIELSYVGGSSAAFTETFLVGPGHDVAGEVQPLVIRSVLGGPGP